MSLPETLSKVFAHIDQNHMKYIETLTEAVAIRSVSARPEYREECQHMIDWMQAKMEALGITCEQIDIGMQKLTDGSSIKLPNVLMSQLGNDPTKKTLAVYGHLDVQPEGEGWITEPFVLTIRDGKMFGRGSSDDKGPVIAWLNAIEAYQQEEIELPINLKFIFEAMEESGSIGLGDMLKSKKDWFKDVDYVCISDTAWLGNDQPCLSHALRGLCYFRLEVECAKMDLHSGTYGGNVHEAMTDLIYLLSLLVDSRGKILIPGIYDDVAPKSQDEDEMYEKIEFDIDAFRENIGTPGRLLYDTKTDLLQHRWRYPCLSIHGIEGAFCQAGQKTVIPGKVKGKFSIRIVPNQEPKMIEKIVVDFVNRKFKELNSPNRMKCYMSHGARTFSEDPNHENYLAAAKAIKHVYKVDPAQIQGGSSVPITLILQEISGKNVVLFPLAAADDNAHSQNEKMNVRNYIEGSKVLSAYIYELAQID